MDHGLILSQSYKFSAKNKQCTIPDTKPPKKDASSTSAPTSRPASAARSRTPSSRPASARSVTFSDTDQVVEFNSPVVEFETEEND